MLNLGAHFASPALDGNDVWNVCTL